MHHRALLLATAAFALPGRLTALALAEEPAQQAASAAVAWSYGAPSDGREHLWECLIWSTDRGQLIAIEKSCDRLPYRDGRFNLLRFTADGKLMDSVRIDQRPTAVDVSPVPREIAGVVPLSDGGLLVIGSIDVEAGLQFVWLDGQGQRLRSVVLPEPKHPFSCHLALRREHSLLLVGSAATGAFALEANLEGEVLWHQQYRQGKPNRYAETRLALVEEFQAAALGPDGESLGMVGISGELNEFGVGPADVWLVRMGAEGKVLDQRTVPGHPFATLALAGGKLAILKGNHALLGYAEQKQGPWLCNLLIVDAELKTIHDEEMDLLADAILVPTAADRFVLAGRPLTVGLELAPQNRHETLVREYDSAGRLQRALRCPIASLPFYSRLAASEAQLFLAAAEMRDPKARSPRISLNCIAWPKP